MPSSTAATEVPSKNHRRRFLPLLHLLIELRQKRDFALVVPLLLISFLHDAFYCLSLQRRAAPVLLFNDVPISDIEVKFTFFRLNVVWEQKLLHLHLMLLEARVHAGHI